MRYAGLLDDDAVQVAAPGQAFADLVQQFEPGGTDGVVVNHDHRRVEECVDGLLQPSEIRDIASSVLAA